MAKILHLELEHEPPVESSTGNDERRPLGSKDVDLCEKLESHALSIASICLSPHVSDGVRAVAVNPMFYGQSNLQQLSYRDLNNIDKAAAGKYVSSQALKARVWNFLEDFERQSGFHTRSRVKQLQAYAIREKG